MHYGFAPGRTTYDRIMRRMLQRRADTTLIHRRQTRNVEAFVDFLENDVSVPLPVDDILIGSHGNASGQLQIVLFPGAPARATYETILQAEASGAIEIPLDVVDHSVSAGSTTLHIKGCKIGQAPQMMNALKEAFRGELQTLTAPKHFHYILDMRSHGSFESLSYSFPIKSRDRITDRDILVTEFQNAGHSFIDGSAVPGASWLGWIPRNFNRRRTRARMNVPLGVTLGRLTRIRQERQFRHDVIRFRYRITDITSAPADREQLFRNTINGDPSFQAGHAYPHYARSGFSSLNEFIDGHNWRFTYLPGPDQLLCTGTRHSYEVVLPITDPATGNLLFNFHPKSGSPHSPIINLNETDNRLFLTV